MKVIKKILKGILHNYMEAADMIYGDLYRQQFK